MKMKNVIVSAVCVATLIMSTSAMSFAAETSSEKETKVTYDNTNEIVDPENPTNPKFAVTIPTSIEFTDEAKEVEADVALVYKNGGSSADLKNPIKVAAKSTNGYKLQLTAGADAVPYLLLYGADAGSLAALTGGTDGTEYSDIGSLDATHLEYKGIARLNGKATKAGAHTDTLTYKVTVGTK